jgi:hypothetical protein
LPRGGQKRIFGNVGLDVREALWAGDGRFPFLGFRTGSSELGLSIV